MLKLCIVQLGVESAHDRGSQETEMLARPSARLAVEQEEQG